MTRNLEALSTPETIVDSLPTGSYDTTFQPRYTDQAALVRAVREIQATTPVTTHEHIMELRRQFCEIALGQAATFIVIEGSCAESVRLEQPIDPIVDQTAIRRDAVFRGVASQSHSTGVLHIVRDRGQAVKPRSSAIEQSGSTIIDSYFGDGVNDIATSKRTPDPSRMVAMALQARDLNDAYTNRFGTHVPAAHEALLMPYEMARIQDGYNVSADLPWIGMRTNTLDHPIVHMLTGIQNPIGVKIGADSTTAHIKGLDAMLNPEREDGKLAFMLRVETEASRRLDEILAAIASLRSRPVVMYDIHGVTTTNNHGEKIRSVPAILGQVARLASACQSHNITLNGLHLETMADSTHRECVDHHDDRPTRPGFVDPRLNPRQLETIVRQSIEYIQSGGTL